MNNWDLRGLIKNLKAESSALKKLIDLTKTEAPPEVLEYFHQMAMRSNELMKGLVKSEDGSRPLTVAVVGTFSAGKSSFINHILQDCTICPVKVQPTTSVVTKFVYGVEERITIQSLNQKARRINRADYVRRVQAQTKSTGVNQTKRFTYALPNNALKGFEVLDTPGFNDPKKHSDGTVTESIMAESNVFFYLVNIDLGGIPKSELKKLEDLKSKAPDTTGVLVISQADNKPPNAIQKLKNEFHTKYDNLFNARILFYSTKVKTDYIDTRDDIITMLTKLRKLSTEKNRASLARAVQLHYDERLTLGTEVENILFLRVSEIEGEAVLRNERLEKTIAGYHQFVQLVRERFSGELKNACVNSLEVKEVPGSGWIWNAGFIVCKQKTLIKNVKSFCVFRDIEKEIDRTLRSLLGDNFHLKSKAFDNTRETCASAAINSISTLSCIGARFDYVKTAREKMKAEYEMNFQTIADAAWAPLAKTLKGMENYMRGKYDEQTGAIRDNSAEFARAVKRLRRVYQQSVHLLNKNPHKNEYLSRV